MYHLHKNNYTLHLTGTTTSLCTPLKTHDANTFEATCTNTTNPTFHRHSGKHDSQLVYKTSFTFNDSLPLKRQRLVSIHFTNEPHRFEVQGDRSCEKVCLCSEGIGLNCFENAHGAFKDTPAFDILKVCWQTVIFLHVKQKKDMHSSFQDRFACVLNFGKTINQMHKCTLMQRD